MHVRVDEELIPEILDNQIKNTRDLNIHIYDYLKQEFSAPQVPLSTEHLNTSSLPFNKLQDFVHVMDRPVADEIFQNIYSARFSQGYSKTLKVNSNGKWQHIEVNLQMVRNNYGDPHFCLILHKNLTNNAVNENLLLDVLNSSTCGIMAFEAVMTEDKNVVDFKWIMLNQQASRILKKLPSDLEGKSLLENCPFSEIKGLFFLYKEALESFGKRTAELDFPANQGKIWYRVDAMPYGSDKIIATLTDITNLKEVKAEQGELSTRLLNMVNSSGQIIAMLDRNFNFLAFNEAYRQEFSKIYGVNISEGMNLGEALENFPVERENAFQIWERALKGNAYSTIKEFSNGSFGKKYFDLKFSPVYNEKGEITGASHFGTDITEKKDLENLLQRVLDSSTAGIMVFNTVRNENNEIIDFEWLLLNELGEKLVAMPQYLIAGKRLLDIMPSSKQSGLFKAYVDVVETGNPFEKEIFYENNGVRTWFYISACKIQDGFVVSFEDISERKNTEEELIRKNSDLQNTLLELKNTKEELQKSNTELDNKIEQRAKELSSLSERFNLITLATNDVLWDWDLKSNDMWWNDSFFKLFGYQQQDVEPTIESWYNRIHPEDYDRVSKHIRNVLDTGKAQWNDEYRFRCSNGSFAYILDRGYIMYDIEGNPERMIGSMMDMSDLKLTQNELNIKNQELQRLYQEFKFVTDFMPQLVWATRPDGYHDFFNKRWYEYTGLSYEKSKDKGWSLVVHPDDYDRTWQVWNESIETGKTYEIEYRFRRYDGQYRWFLGRALPMLDLNGNIVKWFGTLTDIHDQKLLLEDMKKMQEDFQSSNAELKRVNTDLDNFIYTASHDLKAPINNIEGLVSALKEGGLDSKEETKTILSMIESSIYNFKKTVFDLTEITKIQKLNEDLEEVNIYQIIEEVFDQLANNIHKKKATFELNLSIKEVKFIRKHLRSILYNLVSNSLKYSRTGHPPKIRISSFIERKYLVLEVEDNGVGISLKDQKKIFSMFKRLHANMEGTGVGLYILKRIVELEGGKIELESEPGIGTTFRIFLENS